jgi:folate-dependent tRNA-U54 methylase TrmFO/GidA
MEPATYPLFQFRVEKIVSKKKIRSALLQFEEAKVEKKLVHTYTEDYLYFFDILCPLMKQKSVNTFFSLGGSTDSSSASKRREE